MNPSAGMVCAGGAFQDPTDLMPSYGSEVPRPDSNQIGYLSGARFASKLSEAVLHPNPRSNWAHSMDACGCICLCASISGKKRGISTGVYCLV